MPPLTAELAGTAAVIALIFLLALIADVATRARRKRNTLARIRRHAAQGCPVCIRARAAEVTARTRTLGGIR